MYITVDHVVDRSLERAVKLWRYVGLEYCICIFKFVYRLLLIVDLSLTIVLLIIQSFILIHSVKIS